MLFPGRFSSADVEVYWSRKEGCSNEAWIP